MLFALVLKEGSGSFLAQVVVLKVQASSKQTDVLVRTGHVVD